jgi:hypothetical protein
MLKHPYKQGFSNAARVEYGKLGDKNMYEEVEHNGEYLLPLMWVFTYKFDSNGYLIRYKARLCGRGDLQHTEEDTYAATLAAQTFRAVISLATAFRLQSRQYNIINAYTNADLKKLLLGQIAEGFKKKRIILRIFKTFYGLKTSMLL